MEKLTTQTKLPNSGATIELYEWINGLDAEYIQQPLLGAVKVSGIPSKDSMGVDFSPEKAIQEQNHREIECYVAKVTDEKTIVTDRIKIKEYILKEFPSKDYEFILDQIDKIKETGKKK